MQNKKKLTIYTIGHSTHPIEKFINLLQQNNITYLIDIRTIPKSRHNPQFNKEELAKALKKAKIKYVHLSNLGGLRHARADSINTAWQNASFRGYADYMQTDKFQDAIKKLIEYAQNDQVAIMCAEAVPWRCHRSLVGDALLVRGIIVEDVFSPTSIKPHTLTPWAKVHGNTITYPEKKTSKTKECE